MNYTLIEHLIKMNIKEHHLIIIDFNNILNDKINQIITLYMSLIKNRNSNKNTKFN
jgi:hypothetical protein